MGLHPKPITDATYGLKDARFRTHVEFPTKILDMHIHNITEGLIVEIPEMRDKILSIYELVGVPKEIFEKAEFF